MINFRITNEWGPHHSFKQLGPHLVLVIIFLTLFSPFCVGEEFSLEAKSPDQVVRAGDSFSVTCALVQPKGVKVRWLKDGGETPLSSHRDPRLELLHQQGSQADNFTLLVHLSTFNDSGSYSCAVSEHVLATVQVQVGLPPTNSLNITCTSINMETMWCLWTEVPETHLPISYQFTYRLLYQRTWHPCPDSRTKGKNSCYFKPDDNLGGPHNLRVTTSNSLGFINEDIWFNPDTDTTPNPVHNFQVIPHKDKAAIKLVWELPKGWIHFHDLWYKIEYYSQWEEDTIHKKDVKEYVLEKDFPSLEAFTLYTFRVATKPAGMSGFWSKWSPWKSARTFSTDPIGNVKVVDCKEKDNSQDPIYLRDVTCSWEPYEERQLRGYLQRYIVFADNIVKTEGPNITQTTLFGLKKYKKIKIAFLASNDFGNSTQSFYELQDNTGVPGPPSNFQAVSPLWHSMRLTWELPSNPNGIITGYNVQYRADFKLERPTKLSVENDTYSTLIDNLQAFTPYAFYVVALTRLGHGKEMEAYETTLETVPNAPPMNIREVEEEMNHQHARHLHLSWDPPPKEHQRGVIQGYYVYHCPTDEADANFTFFNDTRFSLPCLASQLNLTENTGRITHLQPFTLYTVWVSAYTSAGEGDVSSPHQFRTGETAPADPPNVISISHNSTAIEIKWLPPLQPNGVIKEYKLYHMCVEGTDNRDKNFTTGVGTSQSATLEPLHGYTNYSVQVAACNTVSCTTSAASYVFTQAREPSPPRNPSFKKVDAAANNRVQVNWSPPDPTNGPLYGYEIFYVDEKYGEFSINLVADQLLTYTVTVNCSVFTQRKFSFFIRAVVKSPEGHIFLGQNTSEEVFYLCEAGVDNSQMTTIKTIGFSALAIFLIFAFILVTFFYRPKIIKYYKIYIVGVVPDPKPFPGCSLPHPGEDVSGDKVAMKRLVSDNSSLAFDRQHSYESVGAEHIKEVFDPLILDEEFSPPTFPADCVEDSRASTSSDTSGTSSKGLPVYLGVTSTGRLQELISSEKVAAATTPEKTGKAGGLGSRGCYAGADNHLAGGSTPGDSHPFQLSPLAPLIPEDSKDSGYLSKYDLVPGLGSVPKAAGGPPPSRKDASSSSVYKDTDAESSSGVFSEPFSQSYVKLSQERQRLQYGQLSHDDGHGDSESTDVTQPMLAAGGAQETAEDDGDDRARHSTSSQPLLNHCDSNSDYVFTPASQDSTTTADTRSENALSLKDYYSDSHLSDI